MFTICVKCGGVDVSWLTYLPQCMSRIDGLVAVRSRTHVLRADGSRHFHLDVSYVAFDLGRLGRVSIRAGALGDELLINDGKP